MDGLIPKSEFVRIANVVGVRRWLAVLAMLTIPAGAARAAVSLGVVAAPTLISVYNPAGPLNGLRR
ncbi:MAG TPA: hypothetical protein VFP86_02240 [bacterium]|nr:hypothetical protein [bacterium]